ncbi:MAG TPA: alpha/beta fold hydrolase [Phenylobacterium sp.]|nr:alpha/beta fold hydrolase [Phenylobacterium sp.]
MEAPILIGHSTGAYAAMAHIAAGGAASKIVCVDGFTLDPRPSLAPRPAGAPTPSLEQLARTFRYGWRASRSERDRYIEEVVRASPDDWVNQGVAQGLLRAMMRRCFVEDQGAWLRRPTPEEIRTVSSPRGEARIGPYVDLYDQISVPMLMVWAEQGLSAGRYEELQALAAAAPDRDLVTISATHNVPMQKPLELAMLIRRFVERTASGAGG